MRFYFFLYLSLFMLLSSCNGVGTAKFDEIATGSIGTGVPSAVDTSIIFEGITQVTNKTDSTVTLGWTPHPTAVAYNIFNTQSGISVLITTVVGQGSSSVSLTGLNPGATYKFRAKILTATEVTDGNTNDTSVIMDTAPSVPSSLVLISLTSSGSSNTPTIRVSGVKTGDTVKLFSDASCSVERGSAVATGATVDVTASLTDLGAYSFYATSTNTSGNSSACSSASASYTMNACPSGYVLNSGSCGLSFAGITQVTNKTDSTVTLGWTPHPLAVAYDLFNTISGTQALYMTISGQATSSTTLTGLSPGANYKFRLRIRTTEGLFDLNTNDAVFTMNSAPNTPSALNMVTPASSPGYRTTPTIRVSGVKSGDTIKLFSDSSCSTQRGSVVATGTTVDITSSAINVGAYSFYATATNASGNSSACSTANVTYALSCPAGYIGVPASSTLGVNTFCVAKYEMKNVGGVATSQAASTPWVSINQINSKSACTSLGSNYDLISNPEWMTIAHEIEKTASNWSGNAVGVGVLNRGHSDNSPTTALAVTNTNDSYNGTGNNSGQGVGSGREQKRTHTLSNTEVIWDFAGNIAEWVDWNIGGSATPGPTTCTGGWVQFPNVSCGELSAADYMPLNPSGVSANNYNSNYGLGQFFGATGSGPLRGGFMSSTTNSGVFTLSLNPQPIGFFTYAGFRCVFRLE